MALPLILLSHARPCVIHHGGLAWHTFIILHLSRELITLIPSCLPNTVLITYAENT